MYNQHLQNRNTCKRIHFYRKISWHPGNISKTQGYCFHSYTTGRAKGNWNSVIRIRCKPIGVDNEETYRTCFIALRMLKAIKQVRPPSKEAQARRAMLQIEIPLTVRWCKAFHIATTATLARFISASIEGKSWPGLMELLLIRFQRYRTLGQICRISDGAHTGKYKSTDF